MAVREYGSKPVKVRLDPSDTISSVIAKIAAFIVFAALPSVAAAKDLTVYFIDVEGGQATLFVTPAGESLLIDTGWPGFNGRDADRIVSAAKAAGLKQLDYVLVTHYHIDHAGGVAQLAERFPVKTFIDHGETVEHDDAGNKLYASYLAARAKGKHLEVKVGDKLPVKGLDWTVVTAAGNLLPKAMPGAAKSNPFCAGAKAKEVDPSENARSIGSYIVFGKFRAADLGDLTWNKEQELMCPAPKLAPVQVYIVTHHGSDQSGAKAMVHALQPRVAIMDNGAKKGGSAEAWNTIHESKGLEDIWQVHYSVDAGEKSNTGEKMIANMTEANDAAYSLKLVAHEDGSFDVTNARNGFTKHYGSK